MESSDPGEYSDYAQQPSEVSVELENTETVTKLAEKALKDLKVATPEHSGSDEKHEKSEPSTTPAETVSSPAEVKNVAEPSQNPPETTKTSVTVPSAPARVAAISSPVQITKTAETGLTTPATPKENTVTPGSISEYSSPPEEVDVELNNTETPPVLPAKSSSSDLNPPPTAISTSKETVISYGKISDTNVLTAVSPSADSKTAKEIGLLTFTEMNKTEEGSPRTAKPSLTCIKTNEAIYANIAQKVSVAALSSPSVSSSNLSVFTPSHSEIDCEITDTEGVMQESQKKN